MDWETLNNWKVKAENNELPYKQASDHHGMMKYLIAFCTFQKLPREFVIKLIQIDGALWQRMQRVPREERS